MRRSIGSALAAGLLLLLAVPVSAQSPDFLFKRPAVTVSLQGGWAMPGEGSDLFDFARDQLTIEEGDFAAPVVLAEVGFRLTERFDAAVGLEYAGNSVDSEMRDWVTQDDQPIPQTTEFNRTRLMASLKGYLLPRGRQVSRFAWIPNRWSPYVGVGGGFSWYEFEQRGDFVDYQTLDIFEGQFRAEGRGFTGQALAGLDVTITPHFLVRGEYRYIWGAGDMESADFVDFDDSVDLSGSQVMLGFAVRL